MLWLVSAALIEVTKQKKIDGKPMQHQHPLNVSANDAIKHQKSTRLTVLCWWWQMGQKIEAKIPHFSFLNYPLAKRQSFECQMFMGILDNEWLLCLEVFFFKSFSLSLRSMSNLNTSSRIQAIQNLFDLVKNSHQP